MRAAAVLAAVIPTVLANRFSFIVGFFNSRPLLRVFYDPDTKTISNQQGVTPAVPTKWITRDPGSAYFFTANGASFTSWEYQRDGTIRAGVGLPSMMAQCQHTSFVTVGTTHMGFFSFEDPGCPTLVLDLSPDNYARVDIGVLGTIRYDQGSVIRATALSMDGDTLYSADSTGWVWVHDVKWNMRSRQGRQVQRLAVPTGAEPLSVVCHPNGRLVYVTYGAQSKVAVFARDGIMGRLVPAGPGYTPLEFSLLPPGWTNASLYLAGPISLSTPIAGTSTSYLFGSTAPAFGSQATGLVTAFELDMVTGHVDRRVFTMSSRGSRPTVSGNAIRNDLFVVTDAASGQIAVWEIAESVDGAPARVVAQITTLGRPGNVIWTG